MESQAHQMRLTEGLLDIHICGACRSQFNDVNVFLEHKHQCPSLAKLLADIQQQKQQQIQQQIQQQQNSVQCQSFESKVVSLSEQQQHAGLQHQAFSSLHTPPVVKSPLSTTRLDEFPEPASRLAEQALPHASVPQQRCALIQPQVQISCANQMTSASKMIGFHEFSIARDTSENVIGHNQSNTTSNCHVLSKLDIGTLTTLDQGIDDVCSYSDISVATSTGETVFSPSEVNDSEQQQTVKQALTVHSEQAPHKSIGMGNSRLADQQFGESEKSGLLKDSSPSLLLSTGLRESELQEDEDAELHQELFGSMSRERFKLHVMQKHVHLKSSSRNPPESYHYEQHVQNLDQYVFDESQELAESNDSLNLHQMHDRIALSCSENIPLLASQENDADLSLSVSESQELRFAEQENLTVREKGTFNQRIAHSQLTVAPHLKKKLKLSHGIENPDPSLMQNYRLQGDDSQQNLGQGLNRVCVERRRRHTVADINFLQTLPKDQSKQMQHLHQEQQMQHMQVKFKQNIVTDLSDISKHTNHEFENSGATPQDMMTNVASLQELAKEASELAASLPDNLATPGSLISSRPVNVTDIGSEMAANMDVLDHTTESSLLILPPAHLDVDMEGRKSPEAVLQVPAKLSSQMNQIPEAVNDQHLSNSLEKRSNHLSASLISKAITKAAQPSSSSSSSSIPFKKGKVYHCSFDDCQYKTNIVKDLQRHLRTHTGERPYVCPHCGKDYNRSDKLRVHIRWHTGEKPFKCPQCNYASVDSSSLKKHIRTHTDERPFKCQICPYASRNSSQLIVHLRTHTGDSPFECPECHSKFKINSDLKRHMRIHTGEKPFQCELCDYKCSIKGNLKSHYKINHSPDNQLQCEKCDFSSSSLKLFKEHVKQHTSGKTCNVCQYICSSSSSLKNHLRIHSDERPFLCDFCPYSAKQRGNVKSHMRKRHADKLRSLRRHGRPKGGSNSKRIVRGESARRPLKDEKHTVEVTDTGSSVRMVRPSCKKTYHCPVCDASFVREDSLRCHLRQHKATKRMPLAPSETHAVLQAHGHQEHQENSVSLPCLGKKSLLRTINVRPAQNLFLEMKKEMLLNSPGSSSHETVNSFPAGGTPFKEVRKKLVGVSLHRGLDQIADAASRLYQEQYDVQQEPSTVYVEVPLTSIVQDGSRQVHYVQVPMDMESNQSAEMIEMQELQQSVKDPRPNLNAGFGLTFAEHLIEDPKIQQHNFVDNVVSGQSLPGHCSGVAGTSSQTVYISNPPPIYSTASASVTCVSNSSTTGTLVTYMTRPPIETQMSLHPTTSSDSLVTYVIPDCKSKQFPQSAIGVAYAVESSSLKHEHQEACLSQQQQQYKQEQLPVQSSSTNREISTFQQLVAGEPGNKVFLGASSCFTNSVPLPHNSQSQKTFAGTISLGEGSTQTLAASSSAQSSVLSFINSASASVLPSRVQAGSPRNVYFKSEMMEAPSIPASLPHISTQNPVSTVVTLSRSSSSNVTPSGQLSLGGLATLHLTGSGGLSTLHLTGPVTGVSQQTQQSPTVQYQLQPSLQQQVQQRVIHVQPQQIVVPSSQQQTQTVQFHQQSDLPVNVQVIQQDAVQSQVQQPHTIPINIITPVNIQHQSQHPQIQIIIPPTSFSTSPLTLNPGVGAPSQPQIILQVQEQNPPAPPLSLPPSAAMGMQDASLALMHGGHILPMSQNLLQTILSQLQNGVSVSIPGTGNTELQDESDLPLHIQEVVIQLDPQQLNSALMFKRETNS